MEDISFFLSKFMTRKLAVVVAILHYVVTAVQTKTFLCRRRFNGSCILHCKSWKPLAPMSTPTHEHCVVEFMSCFQISRMPDTISTGLGWTIKDCIRIRNMFRGHGRETTIIAVRVESADVPRGSGILCISVAQMV